MFITEVRIENEVGNHSILTSEKKSNLMRYKSPLIRTLFSVMFFPLISSGIYDQTQVLATSFLSNYEHRSVSVYLIYVVVRKN